MRLKWMEQNVPRRRNVVLLAVFSAVSGIVLITQLFPALFERLPLPKIPSLLSSSSSASASSSQPSSTSSPKMKSTWKPSNYTSSEFQSGPYVEYRSGSYWPGWGGVTHMFTFGDSWTNTAFEVDLDQPNMTNPLGNPFFPGATAANGANWIGYITATHNDTFVRTVNLASGGATVDLDLISPGTPAAGIKDLKLQVERLFVGTYAEKPMTFDWTPYKTLFIIWIGLNDLHNADNVTAMRFGKVFEEFAFYVDELYQNGARNFMFMNIPPIGRSPLAFIIDTVEPWTTWVDNWNTNLTTLAKNFTGAYPDVTTFIFDTFKLYGDLMDDPTIFPESAGFNETHNFCPWYAFGAEGVHFHHPECEWSIDRYLWMNDLHPTTQTFNVTAHAIADACRSAHKNWPILNLDD